MRRLSRAACDGRPAAPPRLVHLGLGQFFRAHQAWYTDRAADAAEWGYAAFSGHRHDLVDQLRGQDGLYSLVTRGPERDGAEVISSLTDVRAGGDHAAWIAAMASAETAVVTLTVTEGAWCRAVDGGLDSTRSDVAADVERLRADGVAAVSTVPGRLVAGLEARRRAASAPLCLVPCDNVPANGDMVRRVTSDLAQLVDPTLVDWMERSVAVVSTVVDRITPRPAGGDPLVVADLIGLADQVPVVTEPFSEWVMAGEFPAGRPRWESAGATFAPDVTDYEHRKLWLLNGAHSLLAYGASALGHVTVADAIGDERCRDWVEEWWATATPHLEQGADQVSPYCHALSERFANARLHDALARVAEDGSQKLPIRVLPVLTAERAAGRMPIAATFILAAWLCHLRGVGAPVRDVRAAELVPMAVGPFGVAAQRVLDALAPGLGDDDAVAGVVAEQAEALSRS